MKSNTLNICNNGDLTYITFPKLEATGIVRHIFSTKLGGVSPYPFGPMNMSFTSDARENVIKNFELLCGCVGIDTNHLVFSKQTHTNNVKVVDKSHCGTGYTKESFQDIDGLITNTPGVALVTQYADCTPLLFFDPIKKVIASSHSGWRGTVKEIGKVTVQKMKDNFGSNPSDIIVGIGPCIAKCCYEVDMPVFEEFKKIDYLDLDKIFISKGNGKFMLDTAEANRQILINAGIDERNIDISDLCTNCNCCTSTPALCTFCS
jgi:YfiH family protein